MKNKFIYRAMRLIARFSIIRSLYTGSLKKQKFVEIDCGCENDPFTACAGNINSQLTKDGYADGVLLKSNFVRDIWDYAQNNPCYANQDPNLGFMVHDLKNAEQQISESIIIGQYFNFSETSVAKTIVRSETIQRVVGEYFGVTPKLVGVNLWWTFPGAHSENQRRKYAHFFHRDIDCFKFLKLFVYLNDVGEGGGPHILVRGSHKKKLISQITDIWRERRYIDAEVKEKFGDDILRIYGKAGTSVFENTLCLHKGETPQKEPRLLLQLEWALNDYGVAHDRREECASIR